MEYQGISATAKLCWARLAQYAGKDGAAFPSQETLSIKIGVTRSQIIRVLKVLEAEGLIKRIAPTGPDKWLHKTTQYIFLWHKVFDGPKRTKQQAKHGGNGDELPSNIFEEDKWKRGERGNYEDPEAVLQ